MKIIESFTEGKYGDEALNEDGIFYNSHFVVLVDGATSKSNKSSVKKGGRIARDIVLDYFETCAADKKADEIIEDLSLLFQKEQKNTEERITAALLIYSDYYKEAWSVGDCKLMINQKEIDQSKKIDILFGQLRSVTIHNLLITEMYTEEDLLKNDHSRAIISEFIKNQYSLENYSSEFGFSVLSGSSKPLSIKKFTIDSNSEIIFSSDGYPVICSSLEDTEKSLSKLLERDPLCYKENKQTKGKYLDLVSYDDRSYIRFSLTNFNYVK